MTQETPSPAPAETGSDADRGLGEQPISADPQPAAAGGVPRTVEAQPPDAVEPGPPEAVDPAETVDPAPPQAVVPGPADAVDPGAPVSGEAGPPDFGPPAPAALSPPPSAESYEDALRLAEALVFAAAAPVTARALGQLLPDTMDADAVIAALRSRYAGRGVELVDVAGGIQFRTAPDLAPRLRKVIEVPRKLPRVAMETLAIIAYHQPCTRSEIEEIRGTSLSQQTLDALLEASLVAPKGRREVPGRPTLWGTTPQFLAQFGLKDLRDLPQRGDLILEPPRPAGVSDAPPITPELPAADEPAADGPTSAPEADTSPVVAAEDSSLSPE